MKLIPEFDEKRQGRPLAASLIDFESGMAVNETTYLYWKREYEKMEATLKKLLQEQIQRLEKLILEAQQIKFHLASLSDEHIKEEDMEGSDGS